MRGLARPPVLSNTVTGWVKMAQLGGGGHRNPDGAAKGEPVSNGPPNGSSGK